MPSGWRCSLEENFLCRSVRIAFSDSAYQRCQVLIANSSPRVDGNPKHYHGTAKAGVGKRETHLPGKVLGIGHRVVIGD
jgi:hypothetical protein